MSEVRKITLIIDGKQVAPTLQNFYKKRRQLNKAIRESSVNSQKYNNSIKELKALQKNIDAHTKKLGKVRNANKGIVDSLGGIQSLLPVAFSVGGVIEFGQAIYDVSQQVHENRRAVQQMTGITGEMLNSVTAQVQATAETFDKDFNETLNAANALAEQMKISVPEALDLINEGALKAADSSGQLLDIVKEYPGQMSEAGLEADEFMALITQQVNDGVFSDKGIDAIKEAKLRLRELTPATEEALGAIGISSKELEEQLRNGSITYFDAIQQVSKKLGELPPQSKEVGQALADIFGGPGEDAGLDYILTLGDVSTNLDEVNAKNLEFAEAQREVLEANEQLNKAFNSFFDSVGPEMDTLTAKFKKGFATILQGTANALESQELSTWQKFRAIVNPLSSDGALAAAKAGTEALRKEAEERRQMIEKEFYKSLDADRSQKQQLEEQQGQHSNKLTKKYIDAEAKLQEQIRKLKDQQFLDSLEKEERELAQVDIKYKRLIEKAQGHEQAIRELEALWKEERAVLLAEQEIADQEKFEQDLIKKQEEFDLIYEATLSDIDRELLAIDQKYEALYIKADEHGVSTTELQKKHGEEIQKVMDKQAKDRFKKSKAEADKETKLRKEQFNSTITAANDFSSAFEGLMQETGAELGRMSEFQSVVAGVQLAVDQASAISSAIKNTAASSITPVDFGLRVATFTATIAATFLKAQRLLSGAGKAPSYAEGGFTGYSGSSPDHTGEKPAGVVHEQEYVIPKWMNQSPLFVNTIGALEAARVNKVGYYANGGQVSEESVLPAQSGNNMNHVLQELAATQARLIAILEKGITAHYDDVEVRQLSELIDENKELETNTQLQ